MIDNNTTKMKYKNKIHLVTINIGVVSNVTIE